MPLDQIKVVGGVHNTYADDKLFNGSPNVQPFMNQTGIATQEITVLETQKYNIEVYNDFKNFAPKETPFITLLSNIGGGVLDRDFDTWTNSYEGVDHPSIGLNNLRVRDIWGDESAKAITPGPNGLIGRNKPIALGKKGEIGGKLFFQYAMISPDGTNWNGDFNSVADGCHVKVNVPSTSDKTDAGLYASEIKDLAPVADADGNLILTLGFSRPLTNAGYFTQTQGPISDVIRMWQNTLDQRQYAGTLYEGVTVNGVVTDMYDYKYIPNQSKQALWRWLNLYMGEIAGPNILTKNNIGCQISVERFMFSVLGDTFIIQLNFKDSTLDYVLGTDYPLEATGATLAEGWHQIVETDNAAEYPVGMIVHSDGAGAVRRRHVATNIAANFATKVTQPVRTVFLLETVCQAKKIGGYALRPFAATEGATYKNVGGWTQPSTHINIMQYDDIPPESSDLEPFDTKTTGNWVRSNEQYHNWMHLYKDTPFAVSIMRLNTTYRFGDTVNTTRQRKFKDFKKIWENIFLTSKKSNTSPSELNFKGTTGGFFDNELYPINYAKHPCPVAPDGTTVLTEAIGGMTFKKWLEELAETVYATDDAPKTLFVGNDFISLIKTNMAVITSNYGKPNVLGYVAFQAVPVGKATLGLEVFEFQANAGVLRFTHMETLDRMTNMKLPSSVFESGRRSPRWSCIVINKNDLSIMTRKGYEDKLHGNLQANDNPFVSIEAYAGGHMFKMRNPANQWFIDMTPNW